MRATGQANCRYSVGCFRRQRLVKVRSAARCKKPCARFYPCGGFAPSDSFSCGKTFPTFAVT